MSTSDPIVVAADKDRNVAVGQSEDLRMREVSEDESKHLAAQQNFCC